MALNITQLTTDSNSKLSPQIQIVGSIIYYVWVQWDGSNNQVWFATSDLDGSNFVSVKLTTSSKSKDTPQLSVVGSIIYYVWPETDATGYFFSYKRFRW